LGIRTKEKTKRHLHMRRKRGSISPRREIIRRLIRLPIAMNINRENMMSSLNKKGILAGKEDRVVTTERCKEMRTWTISILMK
jgi:hypothetical protein